MPREQFQQLMAAVGGGGIPGGGMGALRGMAAGGGAAGRNVIHLTEEEGAAVARLAELGFDRTDAAQVRVDELPLKIAIGRISTSGSSQGHEGQP